VTPSSGHGFDATHLRGRHHANTVRSSQKAIV